MGDKKGCEILRFPVFTNKIIGGIIDWSEIGRVEDACNWFSKELKCPLPVAHDCWRSDLQRIKRSLALCMVGEHLFHEVVTVGRSGQTRPAAKY